MMNHFLNLPEALNPVPAYDFSDQDPCVYGADGLWTFDASSLLTFGILAEEFCSFMIDAHLDYEDEQKGQQIDDDSDGEESGSEGEEIILTSDIDSEDAELN